MQMLQICFLLFLATQFSRHYIIHSDHNKIKSKNYAAHIPDNLQIQMKYFGVP